MKSLSGIVTVRPIGETDWPQVAEKAAAFAEAGVKPSDMKYVSIYDSFTITVLMQLEDLGFCEKGQGGKFVQDGNRRLCS